MVRLEPVESRKQISSHLIWFLIWLGITIAGLYLRPDPSGHGTHQQLGLPPCPSILVSGKPCPGCGLTTSFTATLHGQFGAAFTAHPYGTFLYGLLTAVGLTALYGWIKKSRVVTHEKWTNIGVILIFGSFFLFGVARFLSTPAEASVFSAMRSGPNR